MSGKKNLNLLVEFCELDCGVVQSIGGRAGRVILGENWLDISFVYWPMSGNNSGHSSAGIENGLSVTDPGGGFFVGNTAGVGGVLNAGMDGPKISGRGGFEDVEESPNHFVFLMRLVCQGKVSIKNAKTEGGSEHGFRIQRGENLKFREESGGVPNTILGGEVAVSRVTVTSRGAAKNGMDGRM